MKKIFKNKKMIETLLIILIAVILGIGIYYFFYSNKSSVKNMNDKPTTTTTTTKKLQILDPETKSRPYAVMINNIAVARPLQSGLQDAYIIYEVIVEGGITRLLALFIDQDTDRIGSIRSARHYFLDYALDNDAIYVHHGQSPQAQSDFSKLNIDRIVVDNSKTGWRDKTLKVASEHTLFTSIEKLGKGVGSKRTTRNKELLFNYSIDELNLNSKEGAIPASNITVVYSSQVKNTYVYDGENKVYKRSVNGKEHVDYVTKDQYTFKNVIIYQVSNTAISGDNKNRQNVNTVGNGEGYYISNGTAVPITWSKSSRSSQTVYKYKDGSDLIINDGNTFIQIQPKNKELTIS